MGRIFALVLLLAVGSSASASCFNLETAKRILFDTIANDDLHDYPGSFDKVDLFESIQWFEGHYHAQTDFRVENDEVGGYLVGTVYADLYCDGRSQIRFSVRSENE
jgi:hypothetical protein